MTLVQWVGVAMFALPLIGFVIATLRDSWKAALIFWALVLLGFAWFLAASILATGAR